MYLLVLLRTVRIETGTRCRTNAFVNIYWIGAANGLFGARAAAHNRLRWHFSLMYTGGANS